MRALFVALAVGLAVAATASARTARLHVDAATSLALVLPQLVPGESYSFEGSSKLAARIEAGAYADVFASANTSDPEALYAKHLVAKPVVFAHNSVVVVTPAANPKGIHSVSDLTRAGVRVEIADQTVALGGYTLEILHKLHLHVTIAGRDDDVRTVVAKVVAGTVDAGFVYASDAQAAVSRVHVVAIPPSAEPKIAYAAAVVLRSRQPAAAEAFVAELMSSRAQHAFIRAGFR